MGEYRVGESKLSTSSTVIHAVPPPSAGKARIVPRNHVSPTSLLHPIGAGNYTIPDTSAGCSSRGVPINHETVVALQGANVLHDRSYRPSSLNPFPPFLLLLGSRHTHRFASSNPCSGSSFTPTRPNTCFCGSDFVPQHIQK